MFSMNRTITYSQVDMNLQTNMATIAHFFQDCAICHSESIGKGLDEVERTNTVWYLSGWQIEVLRYPVFGENISVRTWPHDFKSMYGYRNFDILDEQGNRLVQANSIWVFMDMEKGMPAKPTEEDRRGYDLEPSIEMEYAPRKIKQFEPENVAIEGAPIMVKPSFLDSNYHVNNGKYIAEVVDYFPQEFEVKKMRVDYRKAAALGDTLYPVVVKNGDVCQIALNDEDKNPFVVIEVQA